MKRFGKGNKREYQMKRDKYIHSSKIRSVAKKGGRGAYAWGAPGDELDVPPMDKEDPCYESEEVRYIPTHSYIQTITQTPSPTGGQLHSHLERGGKRGRREKSGD